MILCSEQMQLLVTSRSNYIYICLEKEPKDLPILYVTSLCSTKKHMKKYYDFILSALKKSRTMTELKQLRGLMKVTLTVTTQIRLRVCIEKCSKRVTPQTILHSL